VIKPSRRIGRREMPGRRRASYRKTISVRTPNARGCTCLPISGKNFTAETATQRQSPNVQSEGRRGQRLPSPAAPVIPINFGRVTSPAALSADSQSRRYESRRFTKVSLSELPRASLRFNFPERAGMNCSYGACSPRHRRRC